MAWSKEETTAWGAVKKTSDSGQGTLYSKPDANGKLDRNNHVHWHNDGLTNKVNGKSTTVHKSNK